MLTRPHLIKQAGYSGNVSSYERGVDERITVQGQSYAQSLRLSEKQLKQTELKAWLKE
jgi:hypothetical protein